jgi:hypothetical protein
LADYQHLTNVLRRALLVADDLGETAVNAKITDALKSVAEHQRGLARSLDAIE